MALLAFLQGESISVCLGRTLTAESYTSPSRSAGPLSRAALAVLQLMPAAHARPQAAHLCTAHEQPRADQERAHAAVMLFIWGIGGSAERDLVVAQVVYLTMQPVLACKLCLTASLA